MIVAALLAFSAIAPLAVAGRPSPHPPNRVTTHSKEFDAITAFMKKRGYQSDFWVTERCTAPEYYWFYKVYSPNSTAKVLFTMSDSGTLQAQLFVRASPELKAKMVSDFHALLKDLERR